MRSVLCFLFCLSLLSGHAQAGFFDALLGKDKEAPAETVDEQSATVDTQSVVGLASGLIPALTGELGVSEQQASGGMGSLLGLAKQSLSTEEFSQLGAGIPGMVTLLAAAPALANPSGNIGGLLSSAGSLAGQVGGIAQLTQQFESLGLDANMISQFATVALQYFSSDGTGTADLLKKGLSAVLG